MKGLFLVEVWKGLNVKDSIYIVNYIPGCRVERVKCEELSYFSSWSGDRVKCEELKL